MCLYSSNSRSEMIVVRIHTLDLIGIWTSCVTSDVDVILCSQPNVDGVMSPQTVL